MSWLSKHSGGEIWYTDPKGRRYRVFIAQEHGGQWGLRTPDGTLVRLVDAEQAEQILDLGRRAEVRLTDAPGPRHTVTDSSGRTFPASEAWMRANGYPVPTAPTSWHEALARELAPLSRIRSATPEHQVDDGKPRPCAGCRWDFIPDSETTLTTCRYCTEIQKEERAAVVEGKTISGKRYLAMRRHMDRAAKDSIGIVGGGYGALAALTEIEFRPFVALGMLAGIWLVNWAKWLFDGSRPRRSSVGPSYDVAARWALRPKDPGAMIRVQNGDG